MIMFGTEQAKADYVASRQLPTRAQLDDTRTKSLKVEYWVKIAKEYSDRSVVYSIDVGNDCVDLHLCKNLSCSFRVSWSASKLREHFMDLRADYEGSDEYQNYVLSGQNSPLFYPDFQKQQPTHVILHYLLQGLPQGSVLGDIPTNAHIDTNKSASKDSRGDIDLSSASARTPTPPRRRTRRRSRSQRPSGGNVSDTSSISSTVSKYSLTEATKTFPKIVEQLVSTLQRGFAPPKTDVRDPLATPIDAGDQALRLVMMKQKLKSTLKTLTENAETEDDNDSIALIRMRLRNINKEILKQLQ